MTDDGWVVLDEICMTAYVPATLSDTDASNERQKILAMLDALTVSPDLGVSRLVIDLEMGGN